MPGEEDEVEARVIAREGLALPQSIAAVWADQHVYVLQVDRARGCCGYVGHLLGVARAGGWSALHGTTGVVLVSEQGVVRHHLDGYGIEPPLGLDGAQLSYRSGLGRKTVSVPVDAIPETAWATATGRP